MSRIAVESLISPTSPRRSAQRLSVPLRTTSTSPPMESEWYEENGRLYHAWRRGLYMYPHDDPELDRMDLYHNWIHVKLARPLHSAPLRPEVPQSPRILDVGCGTGIWCMEMGIQYPRGEIVGLDLANIQPREIPSSVRFQIPSDFEGHWNLGEGSWDLIHMSMLLGSVSSWPNLLQKASAHLRPGCGYLEMAEMDWEPRCDDDTLKPGSELRQWYDYLARATRESLKPIEFRHDMADMLRTKGLTDITHEVIRMPLCIWTPASNQDKVSGAVSYVALNNDDGLEAISMAPFSRIWGWPRESIVAFIGRVRQEANNSAIHAYVNLHRWTARKA